MATLVSRAIVVFVILSFAQSSPASFATNSAKKQPTELQKKRAVLRVRGFADQILAFRDVEIKTLAIARLADVLWGADEPYARYLFERAVGLLTAASDQSEGHPKLSGSMRARVVALIAKHDAKWAKNLSRASSHSIDREKGEGNVTTFSTAYELATESPAKASGFALDTLQDGVFPYMHVLLLRLRRADETAANELFLKTLARLTASPVVEADSLLNLGTYVFTSPKLDANDPSISSESVVMVGVGDMLITDISGDRPGVPPNLIRAYLKAATTIISRPVRDPTQKARFYTAAYLLLPKTVRFAPELTGLLATSMRALIAEIPQELSNQSAFRNFEKPVAKSLVDTIEEISKESNRVRRDEQFLILAYDLLIDSQFEDARMVVKQVSEDELSQTLKILIDFREGMEAVKSNHTVAERIADQLPQDVEKALLFLELARRGVRERDFQRAEECINKSLRAARTLKDSRRPFLILAAANQVAGFDSQMAKTVLWEAVVSFNSQDPKTLAQVNWERRIEVGVVWRDFLLKSESKDFSFAAVLPVIFKTDPDGILEIVNNLAPELLVADALVSVSQALLTTNSKMLD